MVRYFIILCVLATVIDAQIVPFRRQPRLTAAAAGSGVTYIESSAVNVDQSTEDPETYTFTTTAAVNGYIVVCISRYGGTINSVTFDGTTMSVITNGSSGSDSNVRGSMYGLAIGNKAAGTYTVSISQSAAGLEMATAASHFDGVHQTTSIGTPAIQTAGTASPGTVTVTSAADEKVMSCIAYYEQNNTRDASQTQAFIEDGGVTMRINGSYKTGESSSVNSYTYSGSESRVTIGIGLKPAP